MTGPFSLYGESLLGPTGVTAGDLTGFYAPSDPPATLCYQWGTSAKQCMYSAWGFWEIRIRPARQQFFTLRIDGRVVARLIYAIS